MSTKDQRILNLGGGRYPFKVSDEYFDNLTARIMEQIPEDSGVASVDSQNQENASDQSTKIIDINKGRRHNLWISIISIAASLTLIVMVTLKFIPMSTSSTATDELTSEYFDDDYNEDLMTYTLVDNMDVYYYLSAEDMGE